MFDYYDTLITPEEVADMLGCGMNTTYKLLKSGKIKAMRIVQITAFQVHLHGVLEPPARENKATVTGSRPPADLPEILPHGKSTEMEPCY